MRKLVSLALAMVFVLTGNIWAADVLKLAGSTTHQFGYVEASKEVAEKELNVKLDIAGGGSSTGMKLCIEGKVEVGMASRPLKEKEKKAGIIGKKVGWDAIAVIVNKGNKVESLTIDQLKDIHTGKIKNWKDVGGEDRKIVIVTSHVGSATRDMFQKIAMKKEKYAKGVIAVKTTRLEVDKVNKFKGGIGAVSVVFADTDKVNIVKVNGKEPNQKNVLDKSYKIARPLVLGTMGEAKGNAKKYIDWVLSPNGQKWISKKFISISQEGEK
ncbi:MAG: phosphate ABC transporter substrate-binding protein [Planctomycetota bacterium]|jgi:phosphate transport system substrate-binding protein